MRWTITERYHSGYDEYHYNLDEIEHDPYVLISIISALHDGAWTLDEVQGHLSMLFGKQYQLTQTVEMEVRYRHGNKHLDRNADGNTHTVYHDRSRTTTQSAP